MKQITIITENGLIVDMENIPEDFEIKVRERDNLLNSTIWTKKKQQFKEIEEQEEAEEPEPTTSYQCTR